MRGRRPFVDGSDAMHLRFRCSTCAQQLDEVPDAPWCPACRGPLDRLADPLTEFPRDMLRSRPADMWRYREALPELSEWISLGESMTPLVPLPGTGGHVLCKCEFQLPTGSYKDRGSALLMSYLHARGVTEAVEDSSGNAGASLAAYAARAGIRLRVFCPASASAGKLVQAALYGAVVQRVAGPRSAATEALSGYLCRHRTPYASHLWHPMFLEGIKTMAFEIVEQLDWVAPAAVLCPVGAGSILLGLYRGFSALKEAGVILRHPHLVAVQARNASAVHHAFHDGAESVRPYAVARTTLATGIALPRPVRDRQVLDALHASGGTVIAVKESEIRQGLRSLGRAGFCVEPTSAVVFPALQRAYQLLRLPRAATVVCILSGHGLKTSEILPDLLSPEDGPHAGVST